MARASRPIAFALVLGHGLLAFAFAFGLPSRAAAEDLASRLRTRLTLGGALMLSRDQSGRLGFDEFAGLAAGQVGYVLAPWLDLQLGLTGAVFPAPAGNGGLFAPTLGVTAAWPLQDVRPYVQLDTGPAFTGHLMRPFLRAALGIDFRLSSAFWLGPVVGLGNVFQHDEPGDSTDARFVWLGVTVTFLPVHVQQPPPVQVTRVVVRREPAPPPIVIERSSEEREAELSALLDRALPTPRVELLAPVLFQFDSDELEPIGVAMLHEVASELARRSDIERIEIQGHADGRGSGDYNAQLSQRRAQRVLEWLVEHGIARERLQVAAHGEAALVEAGESEEHHVQNRRVVFRVVRVREAQP